MFHRKKNLAWQDSEALHGGSLSCNEAQALCLVETRVSVLLEMRTRSILHQLGMAGIFSLFPEVEISDSIHLSHSHLASAMKKVSSLRQKETFSFSFCVSLLSAMNSTGLVSLETKACRSSTELVLFSGSAVHFSSLTCCWASGVFRRARVMDGRSSLVPVPGTVSVHTDKSPD